MIFHPFEAGSAGYAEALRLREDILCGLFGLTITKQGFTHDINWGGFDDTQLVTMLLLQPLDKHTVKMHQVAVLAAL